MSPTKSLFDKGSDEALRLDLRDANVSMRIAVTDQLQLQPVREEFPRTPRHRALQQLPQRSKIRYSSRRGGETAADEELIELLDESTHIGRELDQPFGKESDPVIATIRRAAGDDGCQFIGDLLDGQLTLSDFLGDDDVIGIHLQWQEHRHTPTQRMDMKRKHTHTHTLPRETGTNTDAHTRTHGMDMEWEERRRGTRCANGG
jgi:hypothetical protein